MEALIATTATSDTVQTPTMIAIAMGVPPVRLELLQALSASAPATVSQLAKIVGCTRNGLRPHLDALEELGALVSETTRVRGSFRPTRVYRLDRAKVEEIAWSVYDAVIGDQSDLEARA